MGSRSRLVLGRLFFALLLWAVALLTVQLLPTATLALQLSPLACLVLFGLYSAGTVAWSVVTFPECPQAAVELQKDIVDARRDLRKRGVVLRDT